MARTLSISLFFVILLSACTAIGQQDSLALKVDSLSVKLDSLEKSNAQLKWRQDSLEIIKDQREKLLDETADQFGRALTMLGNFLAFAAVFLAIISILVAMFWRRAEKKFDMASTDLEQAQARTAQLNADAESARALMNDIIQMRAKARGALEQLQKDTPSGRDAKLTGEEKQRLVERLEEINKRIAQLETLGGEPTESEIFALGRSQFYAGDHREAIKTFDKLISMSESSALYWEWRAAALVRMGDYETSLRSNNRAIELRPRHDTPWNNKAYCLGKLGRYEEAIIAAKHAIELNPANGMNWHTLAEIYLWKQDKPAMLGALEEAISREPSVKEMVSNSDDFKLFRDDPDFKKLVGLE